MRMEITWYGRTCIRLRGKDAVVVADAYPSLVGATGRGLTGDIVTFSHSDDEPLRKPKGGSSRNGQTRLPTSLDSAVLLDGPGEYEIRDVLLTGVRTYRDDDKGHERGNGVAFTVELDGVHTIHLGDIGHLLTQEELAEIGPVDVACVPIGGALTPTKAAELVAQLDPKIVVPMPLTEERSAEEALGRFFHEMGAQPLASVAKLAITPSNLPPETATILLESRSKT
jgi:L-ascorbate metabolism protein UlaG (beta-lactamase superfamily)